MNVVYGVNAHDHIVLTDGDWDAMALGEWRRGRGEPGGALPAALGLRVG